MTPYLDGIEYSIIKNLSAAQALASTATQGVVDLGLALSGQEGQMFVGLGCGNQNSPEDFEFEHHDPPTVFFHIPVIGIFSRISDEFDLACLPMYEHAIARSDFLAGWVEECHHHHDCFYTSTDPILCLILIC